MDILLQKAEALLVVIAGFAILASIFRFVLIEYRLHRRDKSEVLTARAVAYYKHPDMEPILAGRSSTYVYYITFHTESGDILKLYMTPENYFSIEENSQGILTWQRDRFWKFEKTNY